MLTHAEIYANVIKARPECTVDRVQHFDDPNCEIATALVLNKWTEMLPAKHGIVLRPFGEWCVFGPDEDGDEAYIPWPANQPQSRFHALAEFLVPGSTKEKA